MNPDAIIIVLIVVAIAIMAHHWVVHSDLSGASRLFQVSDVSNHETWALVALGSAAGAAGALALTASRCGKL